MSKGRSGKYPSRTSQMLDYLARAGEQSFLRELSSLGLCLVPIWVAGELLVPEDAVAYAGTLHGLGMQDLAGEVIESLIGSAQQGVAEG